jgi:hypothetical protein
VDADLVLANFERLFPDPEALSAFNRPESAPPAARGTAEPGPMRLQLASPAWPGVAAARTAAMDVMIAVCVGVLGWLVAGATGFWCATAVAALAGHVCTVLGLRWTARVPLASAILHWTSRRARAREMVAELADYPEAQPDPALDLTYFAR